MYRLYRCTDLRNIDNTDKFINLLQKQLIPPNEAQPKCQIVIVERTAIVLSKLLVYGRIILFYKLIGHLLILLRVTVAIIVVRSTITIWHFRLVFISWAELLSS